MPILGSADQRHQNTTLYASARTQWHGDGRFSHVDDGSQDLRIIARYSRPGNSQSTPGVFYSTGMTGILAQESLLSLNQRTDAQFTIILSPVLSLENSPFIIHTV